MRKKTVKFKNDLSMKNELMKFFSEELLFSKPALTCSNSTMETPERYVKSVHKDIRTITLASFWCLYSQLWTDLTRCSGASIIDFEQANIGWVIANCCTQISSNEVQNLNIQQQIHLLQYKKVGHFQIY